MCTHYIDIRLLPDPEFSRTHLLAALYSKLHRALAQLQADDIGVSFPEYRLTPRCLGEVLRLHSSDTSLQSLLATDWLRGMRDHVVMTSVFPVPLSVTYRQLRRQQVKTNVERLRRRRMKRKGETADEARQAIPDSAEQDTRLPYIRMRSQSTGQVFYMFLALSKPVMSPQAGAFNTYGLSASATVPWF